MKRKLVYLASVLLSSMAFASCGAGNASSPNKSADSDSLFDEVSVEIVDEDIRTKSDFNYTTEESYDDETLPSVKAGVEVLKQWNDDKNNSNADGLSLLYCPIMNYYGTNMENDAVIESYRKWCDKNPFFRQYVDNVKVTMTNGARMLISFDKHVQTTEGGEVKTYPSYLRLSGYETSWQIIGESDLVTDANLGKRQKNLSSVGFDNNTPVSSVFNIANVGKRIDTSYWTLVMESADGETPGPLATAMSQADNISMRISISGELKKNYRGRANTLYCDGYTEAGEAVFMTIWVYDLKTKKLACIEESM